MKFNRPLYNCCKKKKKKIEQEFHISNKSHLSLLIIREIH